MKFKGIIPPISTIFDSDGKLDRNAMGRLIDALIDARVHGLLFLGTGGEFSQMSKEQRMEVAEFAVDYVAKRVPVIIGTGGTSTIECIELSQHAKEIGADAVIVINPYYWNLGEEHLFQHYSEIADAVEIPILLYNFPALTGQDISPKLAKRLASCHSNIVGIKDTVDSIGHINEMIVEVKGINSDFSVLCGFDNHLLNTLGLGGDGIISAGGNFAPKLMIQLYESFQQGKSEWEIQQKLARFPELYKLDSPFVNVIKEATNLLGPSISTFTLPPSKSLVEEKLVQVKEILKEIGLIV